LNTSKKTIFWIFVLGGVVGLLAALGIAEVTHSTAGEETCSKCHTMEPMVQSYRKDIHGGANPKGLKAECNDCHLPHSSATGYFMSKMKISLHDAWAQMTYDKDKIDWAGKRAHAKDFVFESGCTSCHGNLETSGVQAGKAFNAHRDYYAGRTTEKTCIECHEHVGHKDLGLYLNANIGAKK